VWFWSICISPLSSYRIDMKMYSTVACPLSWRGKDFPACTT
jgi:hypothetical protein